MLAASLERNEVMPVLGTLMDQLAAAVPRGAGRGGIWNLTGSGQMRDVLAGGARYALKHGYGTERDLLRCEDEGAVADADPGQVSTRAMERGLHQVGSLGSGITSWRCRRSTRFTTGPGHSDSGLPAARSAS